MRPLGGARRARARTPAEDDAAKELLDQRTRLLDKAQGVSGRSGTKEGERERHEAARQGAACASGGGGAAGVPRPRLRPTAAARWAAATHRERSESEHLDVGGRTAARVCVTARAVTRRAGSGAGAPTAGAGALAARRRHAPVKGLSFGRPGGSEARKMRRATLVANTKAQRLPAATAATERGRKAAGVLSIRYSFWATVKRSTAACGLARAAGHA